MSTHPFRMGRLDHVHIRVPNRREAADWYAEYLGFKPVADYAFWAEAFDGGPLQISADGGGTTLALFEATESQPMVAQQTGVAFSVDASSFIAFATLLPTDIRDQSNGQLTADQIIDFDLCWAYDLADPWGNRYELNCYEYDTIKQELVEANEITPTRYWPRQLFDEWRPPQQSEGGLPTDRIESMEPKVLLVGRIPQIMDILRDELVTNYGREIVSCASKADVAGNLAAQPFDLIILGAGFDDETRDDVAAMIASSHPNLEVYLVPRVGEKSPAKLVATVNQKAIEWKFRQVLGSGGPGEPGPGGPPKPHANQHLRGHRS